LNVILSRWNHYSIQKFFYIFENSPTFERPYRGFELKNSFDSNEPNPKNDRISRNIGIK